MRKHKKIISMLLVFVFMFVDAAFAVNSFTLDEALFYAQAKSFFKGDLRKSTMAVKEKQKAISGATAGGRLSMSLDFMKIFEDGPTYQKLFGNVTKGPTAVYNYSTEVKKQPFTLKKTDYTTTSAYFNVYKSKIQSERNLSRYKEAEEKFVKGKYLYAMKEITEESLNDQKKKAEDAKKKYESSLTDYSNKISKLNDAVYLKNNIKYKDYTELKPFVSKYKLPGQNVNSLFSSSNSIDFKNLSSGYFFDFNLKRSRVGSNELAVLVDEAFKNSWELVSMNEQLKIDEYYIYASLDLYKREFGSNEVAGLENLIRAGIYTVDDLDFTLKYDKFVSYLIGRYGEDWLPYFKISLIFFSIKIPKLFKYDQYDGVRHLEDARYELQQRVMQFLQLLIDIEAQKKSLTELVSNLFIEINILDKDYEDLRNSFNSLKAEYDLNQVKYNSGKLKADILISQKDELDELDDKIFSTLLDMNEKILELSYLTGGIYDKFTVSFNSPVPKTSDSPFLAPNIDDLNAQVEKINEQSFSVTYAVDAVAKNDTAIGTADLSLKIEGDGFECDRYQVLTSDGIEVSEIMSISEKFRHFESVFSDLSKLRIKFYRGEDIAATGEFDGYGVIGKVSVIK